MRSLRSQSDRHRPIAIAVLVLAVLAAGIVPPGLSKSLPVVGGLEQLVHDVYRYTLAPSVALDPDIALIEYDDTTARDTRRTSPIDRALLAKAIRAADEGGAKAIGIDFFFAQPTDDEGELIAALRSVKAPVYMVYADPAADGGGFWSAEISVESRRYQDNFWDEIRGVPVERVSPMIGTDDANVVRRWPTRRDTAQQPLAAAMAGIAAADFNYEGAIQFSRLAAKRAQSDDSYTVGMFPTFSMLSFENDIAARAIGSQFEGRYVLIGLDIFNADRFATPVSHLSAEAEVPGVAVHAHMLRQALDRDFPAPLSLPVVAVIGLLFAISGVVIGSLERKNTVFAAAIAIVLIFWLSLPLIGRAMQFDFLSFPMIGWLLSFVMMVVLLSYLVGAQTSRERTFAQGALGKYLAPSVAQQILADPEKLSLDGEERDLFMLFTDLEGFTKASHKQSPRTTARILNHYLDEMCEIILDHGGTIDKFVGDAIVAFWGAPIARDDDAERSVACTLALHACAERLRADFAEQGETLGRTRIGLHCGPVVVGNFGGRQRIQYTALGDAMNTAARLEGANKHLGTAILVSEEVRGRAPMLDYRPIGTIAMSGVDTAFEVFEPLPEDKAGLAARVSEAIKLIQAGDDAGVDQLHALADDDPDDRALQLLVGRLDMIIGGEPYVLGSK